MAAVLTPCASSAARSPGIRETTQICGSRESMLLLAGALSWRTMAFTSRWWSRLTHPYTRMGLRAGRTVALGAGIFGAGYSSGVKASLEDPERVQREVLASVLRQQGGSGDILAPDSRDARLVTRLGVQLIHAAEGHVAVIQPNPNTDTNPNLRDLAEPEPEPEAEAEPEPEPDTAEP